jgi:hypothetical protein
MRISIPQPCHENWQAMSPQGKGRHCKSCSKTVIDFTRMQDNEIVSYFNSHKNICGRFTNYQMNRELDVNLHSISNRFSTYAACGILLLNAESGQAFNVYDTIPAPLIDSALHISTQVSAPARALRFILDTKDSAVKEIHAIRFNLDSFELSSILDSSGLISFQVPAGLSWTEIQIYILEKNGKESRLIIPATSISNFYLFPSEFRISQEGGNWMYYQILHHFSMPSVIEYMGIPPLEIRPFGFELYRNLTLDSNRNIFTVSTIGDTNIVSDMKDQKSESAQVKQGVPDKQSAKTTKLWLWAGVLLIFLTALGAGVIKFIRRKSAGTFKT